MNFSRFQKPSRYINSEFNSSHKAAKGTDLIKFCLAFPDVYEVGMSHLGMRILYGIANSIPFVSAERVFAPWPDLESHLKNSKEPLRTLESGTPLKELDLIGFSLQYELSYTTVLNMLSLGSIPVSSAERLNSSKRYPIVIAGGPCTSNPAPMLEFIDAFVIGDAEDTLPEILTAMQQAGDNRLTAHETLRLLAGITGIYAPLIHGNGCSIKRRFIDSLDTAFYPVCPIVPYMPIVHDRVTIEISRGCSMGCRFCQAGMIYRPVRERSPQKILAIARESVKNSGYDEVSLSSLSAGDYTNLLPLIKGLNNEFNRYKTAISLPSLRVGSINRAIIKEIKTTRKTGFTIAPEAATERLRAVINKDFTDQQYEEAVRMLFEEGWINLKLYYMIGLPTETDADIESISSMAMLALKTAKKNTGRFVNISITVSPFVPKPHTPFQWYGQITLDEIRRKLRYLKEELSSKKLKYKGHNEEMSFLEAVFSRGDSTLSQLIRSAWESGCRLDGWTEHFDFVKWQNAMDQTGIDGSMYSQKTFSTEEKLPWDFIDTGIKKEFLIREYEKALSENKTIDCKKSCTACGLKCKNENIELICNDKMIKEPETASSAQKTTRRIRVRFSKTGRLRYLSHLELVTTIHRALRRADLPIEYSKGFHPTPKVSLGPPLNVGVSGLREFFDMEVSTPFDIKFYTDRLNATMPEGLKAYEMKELNQGEPSLNSFASRYEYLVPVEDIGSAVAEEVRDRACGRHQDKRFISVREGKEVDLSVCIESLNVIRLSEKLYVQLILRDAESVKVRIGEIIRVLFGADPVEIHITRAAMYGFKDGWTEPI